MENMVNPDFWRSKRVLITGHTGFKGSWLALWLQAMGAKVIGMALSPATQPNLFEMLRLRPALSHHMVDIRDRVAVATALHAAQPEVVFHMAAQSLVKAGYEHPIENFNTNVMGTAHVLQAAHTCPSVKVVINVTSDKCYENLETGRPFVETDSMGGADPYSASKGCAELVATSFRASYFEAKNIALASVRAGNVIGGGDWAENRLIPDMVRAIVAKEQVMIRNPHAIRPWQHVLEPLRGYIMLAEAAFHDPKAYSEGWNFAPHEADAVTVGEVVTQFMRGFQGSSYALDRSIHPKESSCLKLNADKARERLGVSPLWSLPEAIKATRDWYRAWMSNDNMRDVTLAQIELYTQQQTSQVVHVRQ